MSFGEKPGAGGKNWFENGIDDETVPGMARGRFVGRSIAGTMLILKAGGFGEPHALIHIADQLEVKNLGAKE